VPVQQGTADESGIVVFPQNQENNADPLPSSVRVSLRQKNADDFFQPESRLNVSFEQDVAFDRAGEGGHVSHGAEISTTSR